MKCILGKKVEMTQKYLDNGTVACVTIVQAGPCVVTQVKHGKTDGYEAIQVGFGEKKNISKPLQGHVKNLASGKPGRGFAFLREMRLDKPLANVERGDVIDISAFSVGDKVECIGTSKGKGFAGVVKRHHFHGQKASHGHKDQERMPGSIGSGGLQHVLKGLRMAGRMGGERVTVKGLEVIAVDQEKGQLWIKGAVPGARNGLLIIVAPEGDMTFKKEKNDVAVQPVVEETPVQEEIVVESAPEPEQSKEEETNVTSNE